MTENKRFERVYGDIEVVCIDHDSTGEDRFFDDGDYDKFVNLLNELNDFKDNVFKVIDKKREWHLLQAKKCRNQGNIKKAIKFEEAIMTLNILRRDIEKLKGV